MNVMSDGVSWFILALVLTSSWVRTGERWILTNLNPESLWRHMAHGESLQS